MNDAYDADERNAGAEVFAKLLLADVGSGGMSVGPCADALAMMRSGKQRIEQLEAELAILQKKFGIDPNRCPLWLPNTYGSEQCGRERGHAGKCCYERMD